MYVVCLLFYAIGKVVVFSFSFLGVLRDPSVGGDIIHAPIPQRARGLSG